MTAQSDVYYLMRCVTCQKLVTPKMIEDGSCKCGGKKMKATNALGFEKVKVKLWPKRYAVGGFA